jgi:choline dehydrogenase-like flavoprotein
MIYQRGNAADYDAWAVQNPGWGWDSVLPAFRKTMDYYAGESDTHGTGSGGEWRVEKQRVSWDVLDRFMDAAQEQGIPMRDHLIDSNTEGVGYFKVNQQKGLRLSSYKASFIPSLSTTRNPWDAHAASPVSNPCIGEILHLTWRVGWHQHRPSCGTAEWIALDPISR